MPAERQGSRPVLRRSRKGYVMCVCCCETINIVKLCVIRSHVCVCVCVSPTCIEEVRGGLSFFHDAGSGYVVNPRAWELLVSKEEASASSSSRVRGLDRVLLGASLPLKRSGGFQEQSSQWQLSWCSLCLSASR